MTHCKFTPVLNGTTTYKGLEISHSEHGVYIWRDHLSASLQWVGEQGNWSDENETPLSPKDLQTVEDIEEVYGDLY